MALSDFLSNGQIPAGSAATSTTQTNALPDWYTNYAMQVLSNQQAAASTPLSLFQGPRVAEFSPTQQQAFAATQQAAGSYQPSLDAAKAGTASAMGAPGSLATAQPFFTQAMALNPLGATQPAYSKATDLANSAAGMNLTGAAQPYYAQSLNTGAQGANMSGANAAQPYYSQSLNTAAQGVNLNGASAAQPYMTEANRTVPQVIGDYMNPYTDRVVDRIAQLGSRNLIDNIMPGIEGRYIGAGQLGGATRGGGLSGAPSGMLTDTARAIRDTNNDILGQQSTALQQGYAQAQQAAQTDLSRQANIGAQMGSLTQAQQQALLAQAAQQAGIGTQMGSLTQAQQQALMQYATQQANIGTQMGSLTQAQQQGALQAAQQFANMGTQQGALSQQQQQLLQQLGVSAGNMQNADVQAQLAAAAQMGALGAQTQNLGLTGAGALSAVGAQQQALAQKNIDAAYQDFLTQQGYPQQQINNMVTTLGGVKNAIPTVTTNEGIVPSGVQPQYQPSTLQSIVGGLATGAGLLKDLGVF